MWACASSLPNGLETAAEAQIVCDRLAVKSGRSGTTPVSSKTIFVPSSMQTLQWAQEEVERWDIRSEVWQKCRSRIIQPGHMGQVGGKWIAKADNYQGGSAPRRGAELPCFALRDAQSQTSVCLLPHLRGKPVRNCLLSVEAVRRDSDVLQKRWHLTSSELPVINAAPFVQHLFYQLN